MPNQSERREKQEERVCGVGEGDDKACGVGLIFKLIILNNEN